MRLQAHAHAMSKKVTTEAWRHVSSFVGTGMTYAYSENRSLNVYVAKQCMSDNWKVEICCDRVALQAHKNIESAKDYICVCF